MIFELIVKLDIRVVFAQVESSTLKKKKKIRQKSNNMSQFMAYIVNVKYTYSTKIYLFSFYRYTYFHL